MKYTEQMILRSPSGYCMPFEEPAKKDVQMSLGYGEQKHPATGETFFHHGIDFNVSHYLLSAVATGTVSAIGSDAMHGIYQTIRYGKYEVTYRHLSNVFANFSQSVKAGQTVAVSGNLLHIEVKFDGEEINPLEFLTMLYGNIKALEHNAMIGADGSEALSMTIPSPYDTDRQEIEALMLRFLPSYFEDLQQGAYCIPEHTEQSLRNIFSLGAGKHYFYETVPSMSNPLGIGMRSMPLAAKVQNLLIADFLNYLAMRHQVYLSTMDEVLKKNSGSKP